jgi:imidazoleglycerol-phosphate dehydratase
MTVQLGQLVVDDRGPRRVSVSRSTRETQVRVQLALDGGGDSSVATGIGFYDHMLTAFGPHGLFDLSIEASGDLAVDEHHTVEDVALVLGAAFNAALGDRSGIRRYGDAAVPMD